MCVYTYGQLRSAQQCVLFIELCANLCTRKTQRETVRRQLHRNHHRAVEKQTHWMNRMSFHAYSGLRCTSPCIRMFWALYRRNQTKIENTAKSSFTCTNRSIHSNIDCLIAGFRYIAHKTEKQTITGRRMVSCTSDVCFDCDNDLKSIVFTVLLPAQRVFQSNRNDFLWALLRTCVAFRIDVCTLHVFVWFSLMSSLSSQRIFFILERFERER